MNLLKLHCKKYDGLSGKGVGIEVAQRRVYLVKRNGKARNPAKSVEQLRIGTDAATAMPKAVAFVGAARPDLISDVEGCLATLAKQSRA